MAKQTDEASRRSENSGKRMVFASAGTSEAGRPLFEVSGPFTGDSKAAKLQALEQFPDLKERVVAGGVELASVPAAGWEPREPTPPDPSAFKGL